MPHPRSIDDAFDSPPAFYVEAPKPPDTLSHPPHYNLHPSGIETIDLVKHESFLRGNILKYVLRAPYKEHEIEDLQKAREYLDLEIQRVREEESNGATRQ